MRTIGIDIGGSKINIVEYSEDGFRFIERIPASPCNLLNLNYRINSLVKKGSIDAVGIGFAGWVRNGKILKAPNISIEPSRIEFDMDVPFLIENDATCFVMGLYHSGKYGERISGITLGTGIGCGLVIDGRVLRGVTGELGHTVVGNSGLRCVCGGTDHLECYFSGWAFKRKYGDVKNAFETGRVYSDEGFRLLSKSIANLIMTIDPDSVVIGGGMGRSVDIKILNECIRGYLPGEFTPLISKTEDELLPAKGAALLPVVSGWL